MTKRLPIQDPITEPPLLRKLQLARLESILQAVDLATDGLLVFIKEFLKTMQEFTSELDNTDYLHPPHHICLSFSMFQLIQINF